MAIEARTAARLAELAAAGLARRAPAISDRRGMRYRLDGREVVGLCSNDYLGLADDLGPAPAATSAGAGGSRLICGDLPIHRDVERTLAELCGTEDAVLFSSGFACNVGVLPTVIDADDTVLSDALNHASLIDGLRLSKARIDVIRHRDTPTAIPIPPTPAVAWWVSESIFSMDGDRLDLDALRAHHARGGATYVDDAHAFGLYEGGRGLLASQGTSATVTIGTLSKAAGVAGAFAAASATVCRLLRSRARSFVFSTGPSPTATAQIALALELLRSREGDERRARLWSNTRRLAALLGEDDPPSPIFPLLIGDNTVTLDLATSLLDRGWHVQPIRPPTVPTGTSRLRITVSAAHEPAMIDGFVDDLRRALDRLQLPLRLDRGAAP